MWHTTVKSSKALGCTSSCDSGVSNPQEGLWLWEL